MSQTFFRPNDEQAVKCQRSYEVPAGPLFLRTFCSASFVSELVPDAGLHAFAHFPQREHELLRTIAERSDSILTLAYNEQKVLIGQVSLLPATAHWLGIPNLYEIALEVSADWRRQGIVRQLLKMVSELECFDDLIVIGMGLSWHWDFKGLGLTPMAYRALIERLFARYGFAEYLTSDENIRMDPANTFLARLGYHVPSTHLSQFYQRLLQSDTLPGM
ncbi:N-acetyltransferase [Ktedonosporobacter rubrisoli]|uniref:N-acetyltransferase n=1 Tax=Ktedonosporobacter rubrisoli TaxID=2509675 RepID=A0A4P6JKI2_KTERU|nr:GNAT family N-acetyltransferase [Ktedonosporobacter rubrisoli]QBD75664.1 N-acetyltransferase [Ktedonosporobacter rubrisoli]